MSPTVIDIQNLSKVYQLGEISTGSLSRDLSKWCRLKSEEKEPEKEIRAIENISLEIKEGDVLGIIGGNGAGKSTLLKILSRITKPTKGRIRIRGRIASLLEVGTGFHPDLTGRENIFLNGAILGMRNKEIQAKLDEIIAFAGVERFIDTPVKRYSSGMYVRLAFAVAAHLEPEILIIDEVLAVGDINFQKKCLGKMKEVSQNDGRTVIFVSHNMASVKTLCSRAISLKKGQVQFEGNTEEVVNGYLNNLAVGKSEFYFENNQSQIASINYIKFADTENILASSFLITDQWQIKVGIAVHYPVSDLIVSVGLITADNIPVRTIWSKPFKLNPGFFEAVFFENEIIYSAGTYHIVVSLSRSNHTFQYIDTDIYISFEENPLDNTFLKTKNVGLILNQMDVQINQIFR
ncbi:ABC transporter ATP-binding protein [Dyadobacter sp. CY345]|uniref:ABC transporter ATP-binding protein n=1 Tax=Dyadobacter sp. CY345 TaxID=2909335 RepID=UPI001F1E2C25|nr:ABC transporter ATP-binding protein [Dyadobacter sp. CY345]MCF2446189.1 ABC transporter ATP-binding protein [Dyadobacter sp. CY345]